MKPGNLGSKELAGNRRLFDCHTLHSLLEFVTTHLLELTRMQQGILVCLERPGSAATCIGRKLTRDDLDSAAYRSIRPVINQAVVARRLGYKPRWRPAAASDVPVNSFIAIPLATDREVFGFFYGQRLASGRPLTAAELVLVENFVIPASISIENRLLHDSNVRDPMLGIYKSEHFKKRLAEELQRGSRYRKPVSLIVADIDDFNRINSILDYAGGNAVLQGVTEVMGSSLRATDVLARLSGDRFAVLLPETDHDAALRAAERLKTRVEAKTYAHRDKRLSLTISIGLVSCPAAQSTMVEDVISDAENALRAAREKGSSRIASLRKGQARCDQELILIGECPAIKNLVAMIDRLATVDATILITGETGTGKEVVAKMIHHKSLRRDKPFVVVNCGAIPENLIESELFGHERGSFTGAYATQKGKFEQAHGGSILLDEIGELPLHLQPKILRAVEEGKIQRIGGKAPIPVDVRILAATNKNLQASVSENKFRQDLFYRINVISLQLPAVRDRGGDAMVLARHFVRRHAINYGKPVRSFTPEAEAMILQYNWPGNVRELAHLIERAVIMDQDGIISPKDLDLKPMPAPTQRLEQITSTVEKDAVQDALTRNRWNISKTSRELDISRVTLKNMIKKFGLKRQDHRVVKI